MEQEATFPGHFLDSYCDFTSFIKKSEEDVQERLFFHFFCQKHFFQKIFSGKDVLKRHFEKNTKTQTHYVDEREYG
jgi:hypothetical protein